LLRTTLEKFADWALPFFLIAIGLMIVLDKLDVFIEPGPGVDRSFLPA
jgi:cadmium resistance protein CadD (predicted permease)